MRIEVVKQEERIFHVKFTPSWVGRVFGRKERIELFKFHPNEKFIHYPGRGVYENQYGERQNPLKQWVVELDKYRKKW